MTASDPTTAHHVLVETTTFEDQPNARHLCTVCGAESVGEAPPLPCPGPERSLPSSRVDAAAGAARVALAKQFARDHHLVGTSMYDTACSCGGWPTLDGPPHHVEHVALAVMAVADEEQAEPRAEVERLRHDALVSDLRGLADALAEFATNGEVSSGIAMGWREGVRIAEHNVRTVLDKHAGASDD